MGKWPEQFVGTWFLQGMSLPGALALPAFLNHPVGVIVYAADGFMSTTVSSLVKGDGALNDGENITPYEKTMHYAGFWEVQGTEVIHTILFSLNPNELGIQRPRQFRIEGDDIFLTDGTFESHYSRLSGQRPPAPIEVKAP